MITMPTLSTNESPSTGFKNVIKSRHNRSINMDTNIHGHEAKAVIEMFETLGFKKANVCKQLAYSNSGLLNLVTTKDDQGDYSYEGFVSKRMEAHAQLWLNNQRQKKELAQLEEKVKNLDEMSHVVLVGSKQVIKEIKTWARSIDGVQVL